jgi:fluoride ion exporter CrcB/FEX
LNAGLLGDCNWGYSWLLGSLRNDRSRSNNLWARLPYATLAINVLGSFLMGFLYIETIERLTISPYLRIGVLTGFIAGLAIRSWSFNRR